MGWVENKIRDHQTTNKSIGPLWNSLRDSIGEAVAEFRLMIHDSKVHNKDCKARGNQCIRVEKAENWIDVFLATADETVRSALCTEEEVIICRYRLNSARSALEFYQQDEEGCVVMTADEVSQAAVEKFLFDPFPTSIVSRSGA